MSSKIKVDTIENVAGSGNVSLGSGHNLVVPGNITGQGTLGVSGNTTMGGTAAITGNTTMGGTAAITGDLTVDTSTLKVDATNNRVGIGTASPTVNLDVTSSGNNFILVKDSSSGSGIYLKAASDGAAEMQTAGGNNTLGFRTSGNERMQIDGSGNLRVPGNAPLNGQANFYSAANWAVSVARPSAGSAGMINFYNGSSYVGGITTSTSATQYNTSSDYRLKENVVTDWDATTRLKQLKPSRFNFKENKDVTVDGFLAHEVSSIIPEAIFGTKDATQDIGVIKDKDGVILADNVLQVVHTEGKKETTDADGNKVSTYASDTTWAKTKTEDVYQGIDQSKLVPLLVKSLQEALVRIEALESK